MDYEKEIKSILEFYGQDDVMDAAAKAKAFDIWVHTAPVGFAKVSGTGVFLEVNQTLCRFLQMTEPEVIGTAFASITPPPLDSWDLAMVERVISGEIDDYILPKVYEIAEKTYRFAVIHPVGFRGLDDSFSHFWVLIIPTNQEDVENLQMEMVGKVILPPELSVSQKKKWLHSLMSYASKYPKEMGGIAGTILIAIYLLIKKMADEHGKSVTDFLQSLLQ